VGEAAVADSTQYVGRTEAVSVVDLRARVTGFLMERDFEEGRDVRQGDLLYAIEREPYQASVDVAEAAVAQTEATLANAESYLNRLNQVTTSGGASEASRDTAQRTVLETRALLQERRAQLTQARLNLGYTEIRAPISGRIGRTSVHVGNLVGPDSGVLATIVQLNPIWVSFPVSDRDYLGLQRKTGGSPTLAGLVPTISLVDGTEYPHRGKIDFQDNRVDRATGTIMLRATFPNPQLLLRPGQFVKVIQSEQSSVKRLVIPQASIQRDQVGPYVFTVDPGKKVAEIRRVTLGDEYGTDWIVTGGLSAGEWVISEGIQKVTSGIQVDPSLSAPSQVPEGTAGAK
jgi:membrane fusion protein (multidrug efflux system)